MDRYLLFGLGLLLAVLGYMVAPILGGLIVGMSIAGYFYLCDHDDWVAWAKSQSLSRTWLLTGASLLVFLLATEALVSVLHDPNAYILGVMGGVLCGWGSAIVSLGLRVIASHGDKERSVAEDQTF